MATTFVTPVSISLSGVTSATWTGISLSGTVPSGTTGVILLAAGGATSTFFGARMTGSTDAFTSGATNSQDQQTLITGLNGSLSFDFYTNVASANVVLWLIGYFGSEATFNTNSSQLSGTITQGSYGTFSVSALAPSGATAAIVTTDKYGAVTFRQNGSTDDFSSSIAGASYIPTAIVGPDASSKFQARAGVAGTHAQVMGYITSGFTWNSSAINRTPGTAGSFQNLTTESGAIGYLYQTSDPSVATSITVASSSSTSLPFVATPKVSAGQLACGTTPQAKLQSITNLTLYELGYFTSGLSPNISGQTSTSSVGTIGPEVSEPSESFSNTIALGSISPTISQGLSYGLTAQDLTFVEGSLVTGSTLTGQTITSTEGVLTTSFSNSVTLGLSAVTAGFSVGTPTSDVFYILDQNQVIMAGQTITSSEGTIALEADYFPTAQTLTSAEGTIAAPQQAVTLTAETITSAEGIITAQSGANFNANLSAQDITSSEGAIALEVDQFPTAQTVTSAEGTLTFSNVGGNILLGAQTITFTEGVISSPNIPLATGPPLFIPPQLGKPVTTRTFSWLEMASRAWGSEFRAPDHRIYQFSGGNYKDSTDLGTTGIYSPNLGTPDNP